MLLTRPMYQATGSCQCRPVGRGGGVFGTPHLTSKTFYIHRILSVLPLESGRLVSLLLRIIAVQTSLVAAHGGPARNARVSYLCRRDKRTRVNTCVNKLENIEHCGGELAKPRTQAVRRRNGLATYAGSNCIRI